MLLPEPGGPKRTSFIVFTMQVCEANNSRLYIYLFLKMLKRVLRKASCFCKALGTCVESIAFRHMKIKDFQCRKPLVFLHQKGDRARDPPRPIAPQRSGRIDSFICCPSKLAMCAPFLKILTFLLVKKEIVHPSLHSSLSQE